MITVQTKGVDGIRRALKPLLDPELTNTMDKANKAAANTYAKALRPEARKASRRMGRAVRVKRARTGKPEWVVGFRRKAAFFTHWVIGGTRDHGPRRARALVWEGANGLIVAGRVRGVKPNPIVERVATREEARSFSEAEKVFVKETGL